MKRLLLLIALIIVAAGYPVRSLAQHEEKAGEIDAKEIIFEHLGDAYGWEVPFNHHKRIPLPIIVKAKDGGFHIFSSARIQHGEKYTDDGATFMLAPEGSKHQGKVVQLVDGEEYRPLDISITKNVAALFITIILVSGLMLWLANWYGRKVNKAPRRGLGAVEVQSLITISEPTRRSCMSYAGFC
ncbi:MAG: hypothetical protein K2K05_00395, partial [Muribaculaceae bacterium]|nr:hypothetical protein [Muribaculaceae bacterium]